MVVLVCPVGDRQVIVFLLQGTTMFCKLYNCLNRQLYIYFKHISVLIDNGRNVLCEDVITKLYFHAFNSRLNIKALF